MDSNLTTADVYTLHSGPEATGLGALSNGSSPDFRVISPTKPLHSSNAAPMRPSSQAAAVDLLH